MRLIHARMPRYILLVLSILAVLCAALSPLGSNEMMILHPDESAYTYPDHDSTVVGIHQQQMGKHFSMPLWFILFLLYIAIAILRSQLPRLRFDTPFMILLRSLTLRPLKFTSRFVACILACPISDYLQTRRIGMTTTNTNKEVKKANTPESKEQALKIDIQVINRDLKHMIWFIILSAVVITVLYFIM